MYRPFLNKDEKVPDYYGIKVEYIDGTKDNFDKAIFLPPQNNILEIITHEDLHFYLIMTNIKKIELDKNFTKLVNYVREKKEQEEK